MMRSSALSETDIWVTVCEEVAGVVTRSSHPICRVSRRAVAGSAADPKEFRGAS